MFRSTSRSDPLSAAPIAIAALTPEDWNDVRRIYAEGIPTGNATLETEPPAWEE